jgi:hypothetical protein
MALATWWRGDALPPLVLVPGFHVGAPRDVCLLVHVTGLEPEQVRQRLAGGHQPDLAYIAAALVGDGGMAPQQAAISELDLCFALAPAERYLWDFATLPAWQGYGVYPRLLQQILLQQALPVTLTRVGIIYAPETTPSGVGMDKAGLRVVSQLSFGVAGGVGLAPPRGASARADRRGPARDSPH